jgi:hypothetical protein
MAEKEGHFEQGRWVVDPEPAVTPVNENVMDKRLSDATLSVQSSVADAIKVAHDLVTTEEGKKYIEKNLKDMQSQIEKSFGDIMARAKDELDKNIKSAK